MSQSLIKLQSRAQVSSTRRWVIKIGSALLTRDGQGVDREAIAGWVAQMSALKATGLEVVLVSSGAVAEGMSRLGWQQRPESIHELQAAAAVGQMRLVQTWESCFQEHHNKMIRRQFEHPMVDQLIFRHLVGSINVIANVII